MSHQINCSYYILPASFFKMNKVISKAIMALISFPKKGLINETKKNKNKNYKNNY